MSEEQNQSGPEAIDDEPLATEENAGGVEEELRKQLELAQQELVGSKEDVLRAHAEAQNSRRRAEQDIEKAHKFGQEKIINDLLPVVDNLERALAAVDHQDEGMKVFVEGVELTLKSLIDTLKRHKVDVVNPAGEPFDPQAHQAVSAIENPDVEPNTVLDVFQKGYTLNGRLVRPAMVVVSKAPS